MLDSLQALRVCVCVCASLIPVSELGAQGEVVGEEVLLRRDGSFKSKEGVVLHTGLPQVLTGPVVHHVETQQRLPGLCLCARRRRRQVNENTECGMSKNTHRSEHV